LSIASWLNRCERTWSRACDRVRSEQDAIPSLKQLQNLKWAEHRLRSVGFEKALYERVRSTMRLGNTWDEGLSQGASSSEESAVPSSMSNKLMASPKPVRSRF
jgi:hypothetical protein